MVSNCFCDTVALLSAGRRLHAIAPQRRVGEDFVTCHESLCCAVLCCVHVAISEVITITPLFSIAACKE